MPARKRIPERKSRSGPNIPEWRRSTVQLKLRVSSAIAERAKQRADELGLSTSEYVSQLVHEDDVERPS